MTLWGKAKRIVKLGYLYFCTRHDKEGFDGKSMVLHPITSPFFLSNRMEKNG